MSISQTITDHPELEGIDSNQVLDLLWKHDVIGVSLVGLGGRWIHPSPELCEWLGYTRAQLEAMTWMDITVRTDRKDDQEAVSAVMNGSLDHYSMFKTYIRKNSTLMPATLAVIPIKDTGNNVVMFLSQIERDERGEGIPPIDELRVVFNCLKSNRKTLIAGWLGYTIAIGLAGDGALRWLGSVVDALSSFGISP